MTPPTVEDTATTDSSPAANGTAPTHIRLPSPAATENFTPTWKAGVAPERPAPLGRSTSEPECDARLGPPQYPASAGTKRSVTTRASPHAISPTERPPDKKRRVERRRTRPRPHLEHFSFPPPPVGRPQPPSPLFFSNTRHGRPPLPPRFSSGEAAMRMLSKAEEEPRVRTVQLARGSVPASSPLVTGLSVTRSTSTESAAIDPVDVTDKTEALRILAQVGTIELLEQDNRAVFIVDLGENANYSSPILQVAYANSTLKATGGLLDLVNGSVNARTPSTPPSGHTAFKKWVLHPVSPRESVEPASKPFPFADYNWTRSTLRRRVRVVSGTHATPMATPARDMSDVKTPKVAPAVADKLDAIVDPRPSAAAITRSEPQDYFGNAVSEPAGSALVITTAEAPVDLPSTPLSKPGIANSIETPNAGLAIPGSNGRISNGQMPPVLDAVSHAMSPEDTLNTPVEHKLFDWTRLPPDDIGPGHIKFARSVDWAATPLGPIETWSSDLRMLCNLVMGSPHPSAAYLGDHLVTIYNEAYIPLAGKKHPTLMGSTYREAWPELWDDLKDVFVDATTQGRAIMKDDDCLFLKRHNHLEETFFSWSIIPIVGMDGTVRALYNPAFEKTRRKLAERRMLTLREVGEKTALARDVKSFWAYFLEGLEPNPFDTPFALVYSVSDESDSDASSIHSSSVHGTRQCVLEGTMGVPDGHPAAPDQIDLRSGQEGYGPAFREAMQLEKPLLLEADKGEIPTELLSNIEWRGFGDPCRAVSVCPVHSRSGGDQVLGFLVVGINPRRSYDVDYELFLQLLSRQCATSLASVVLFEEEVRKGQKAARLAAIDRIKLAEELAIRTQEAQEIETKFTRMAESSPAGLFIADGDGQITYSNDAWFQISRVEKTSDNIEKWIEYVHDDDRKKVRDMWRDLIHKKESVTDEFRFKSPWEGRKGKAGDTWVLFSAHPQTELDDASHTMQLKNVFGNITNISQQKWAEGYQKRRMEEAVELKKAQERFVDITSHELRNPLSAILQCADEISSSLGQFREEQSSPAVEHPTISSSIDAAETITLCANHQKRIVDDVLTLSKIDAQMLMITPVDAQPLTVTQSALKMFDVEVQTADIDLRFVNDDSYTALGIDWVRLDPSRVLQVLINLTTNAIKFTTSRSQRTITVTISAHREPPSRIPQPLVEYFPTRSDHDVTEGADWGTGEELYIQFAVQDTGRGLTPEERKLLFMRFSQASPRTHVQYGGSGLGLFISRELAELQGGEIGVRSEAGRGSTFAFYVKARRSAAPPDAAAELPMALTRHSADAKARTRSKELVATAGPALAPADDAARSAADSPAASTASAGDVLHVMVVEDNLINQKVTAQQLRRHGCAVQVANHGVEALARLAQSPSWRPAPAGPFAVEVGVVLMDQEMPVMDGMAATRRIRELEREGRLARHVPIIAVTANARAEQIAALKEAGVDDVATKPFRVPDLIPKIEALTKRFITPGGEKEEGVEGEGG